MKKITIIAAMLFSMTAFSQEPPQGIPPANNTNDRAAAAWYRGGNNAIGTNPPGANIFGTMWDSPIYTYTNGIPDFATYTVQHRIKTPLKTFTLAH